MANTLVTKLKAVVNNDNLPLFGMIKLKQKLSASAFKIRGSNTGSQNVDTEIYSPDGTLQYGTDEAAQTITVPVRSAITRTINFVGNTQYAILKKASDISGIEACIIVNELELGNAPLDYIFCNGDFHINKFPASLTQIRLGDTSTDKGSLSGDLSEIKSTALKAFSSFGNNRNVTGSLSSIVGKYTPTEFRTISLDASLVEGDINLFKELMANSTYDSGSLSTTSLTLSFRNATNIEGSVDDLITYLTGKIFSKKVSLQLSGTKCTYNGEAATNMYVTFDASGNPTIS